MNPYYSHFYKPLLRSIALVSLLLTFDAFGQTCNFIPNPSFEDRSGCPTSNSMLNLLDSWVEGGDGNPDYMNTCDHVDGSGSLFCAAPLPPPDGDGFVAALYTAFNTEYLATCLDNTLVAGLQYTLQLSVAFGRDANVSPAVDITLYGTPNCSDLIWPGENCPTGIAGWQELGFTSAVVAPKQEWRTISITFTPTVNINAIAIGPECAPPAMGIQYFYLDDLMLCAPIFLPSELINFSGKCVQENLEFSWSTASEQQVDRFSLEYSNHGQLFEEKQVVAAVGNSSAQLNYSCKIPKPEAAGYYRLKTVDLDGNFEFSDLVYLDVCSRNHLASLLVDKITQTADQMEVFLADDATYQLVDHLGRIIRTGNSEDKVIRINKAQLSSGIFYVKLIALKNGKVDVVKLCNP